MENATYRISGDLENLDNLMNNTFWNRVERALTKEILEFFENQIETYLGVNIA